VELLYFDLDHGVERLLFVRLDPDSATVDFQFEKGPDPSYDEEGPEVPVVSLRGSTKCPDPDQFFGFCRALVAAMAATPFSLQDPGKSPFAAMPHSALVLDGIGPGVWPGNPVCRIPRQIFAEVFAGDQLPERLAPLAGPDR
jgi:hypothetical protein